MTVAELLRNIGRIAPGNDVGLSAIGVTELVHGIYRADSIQRAETRRQYLEALLFHLPVFDYTLAIAELAGRIDGQETMKGNKIPFADLLIGATALHHGYALLTTNLRHFRLIPNLQVLPF